MKRIVNQIVSQSVTKGPLVAINTYTKFFAGEIVERAREVQEEYAKAYDRILAEKWRKRDEQEEEKKKQIQNQNSNGQPPSAAKPPTTENITPLNGEQPPSSTTSNQKTTANSNSQTEEKPTNPEAGAKLNNFLHSESLVSHVLSSLHRLKVACAFCVEFGVLIAYAVLEA